MYVGFTDVDKNTPENSRKDIKYIENRRLGEENFRFKKEDKDENLISYIFTWIFWKKTIFFVLHLFLHLPKNIQINIKDTFMKTIILLVLVFIYTLNCFTHNISKEINDEYFTLFVDYSDLPMV